MSTMPDYKENFYRAISLAYTIGTKVEQRLFQNYLLSKNQTLPTYISANQHEIFHMYSKLNSKCCQCPESTPHRKLLTTAQMGKLFSNFTKLPCHDHKSRIARDPFCCCCGNPFIKPEDLDITLLNLLMTNVSIDLFWESCLNGKTLEQYLNDNIHRIFHLWKPHAAACCVGGCSAVNGITIPCLKKLQWLALFQKNQQSLCKNDDCCSYSSLGNLSVMTIDKSLSYKILRYVCPLLISVNAISEIRNEIAHNQSGELSDMDLQTIWEKCKENILIIANNTDSVREFKDDIEMAKERWMDTAATNKLLATLHEYRLGSEDHRKVKYFIYENNN